MAPTQASIGRTMALFVRTNWRPGDKRIDYRWTATSGTIDPDDAPRATYTCEVPGDHTVTITIGESVCLQEKQLSLTCVE